MSFAALAGLVLALAGSAQAADVTWEAPTSVYTLGDATVLTTGTLITAESYGDGPGLGDYTVNGVEFTGVEMRANFTNDSSGAMGQTWQYINWGTPLSGTTPPGPHTEFAGLLDGTSFSGDASTTITLDNLEIGKTYLAQFFIGDQREAANDGNPDGRYLDGNYKITGGANTSDAAHIMPIHSFVGTWVADATTQEFTITNTDGAKPLSALLNAAQWRAVAGGPAPAADPEITSITSLGGGNWELKLKGKNSTTYEFFSSPTLDFDTGTLVPLTTVILGSGGGTDVTTTTSGDATVEMSLGDLGAVPVNFVRAVGP